jgi:hypothetical protein
MKNGIYNAKLKDVLEQSIRRKSISEEAARLILKNNYINWR